MSLNGLDAPAIQSAYQTASVEAGGWFLLKYISRDSVELLARGKNGVHEARNAIAKYEDQSPLYGLIIYRRRKVLIKYIPEGTSRLLQARTAVHFQDVQERYSPYETLLEISHADGLSDTALASSFPLHTASPSASSSRLHEISEDGEDPGAMPKATRTNSGNGSIFGTRQYKLERRVDQLMRPSDRPTPTIHISSESSPRASSPLAGAPKPSISQFLVRDESGKRSITSLTSPSASTFSEYAGSSAGSETSTTKEPESTISSAEPAKEEETPTQEIDKPLPSMSSTNAAHFAPEQSNDLPVIEKISSITSERSVVTESEAAAARLEGAGMASEREVPLRGTNIQERSSMSERAGSSERVKSDAYDEPYDFSYLEPKPKVKLGPRIVSATDKSKRPSSSISAMPAAYRPSTKKPEQPRPKSQVSAVFAQPQSMSALPTPPPIPDLPEYNPRPLSRGSVKSLPSHKSTVMTPDKLRLMKAVELRKKQLRKSNPQLKPPQLDEDVPNLPKPLPAPPQEAQTVNALQEISGLTNPTLEALSQTATKKPDSGISMGYDERVHREGDGETLPPTTTDTWLPEISSTDQPGHVSDVKSQHVPEHETKQPQRETNPKLESHRNTSNEAAQVADVPPPAPPKSPVLSQKSLKVDTSRSPSPNPSIESPPAVESDVLKNLKASSTANDSPTLRRTADIPAFSTSLEHLITGIPEIQTTAATRPTTANDSAVPLRDVEIPHSPTEDKTALEQLQKGEVLPLPAASSAKHGGDLAKRRRGIVEPLHIDVDKSGPSDGEFGSDDEFFEELKSATLHEAKPMSVSKSPGPGAQFFQRRPSDNSLVSKTSLSESPLRTINVVNGVAYSSSEVSQVSPEQPQQRATREVSVSPEPTAYPPSSRSGSASHNSPPQERNDPLANLRRNVSDGISKRWQAIAEQSTRDVSPPAVRMPTRPMTPETNANAFIANDRRPTMRSPRSRTSSYRGRRTGNERASAYGGNLSQLDSAPVWNTMQDGTSSRDSVSVKARIVRPQSTTFEQAEEGATPEPAVLQSPQIEINHRRGIPTPTPVSQAFLPPLEPTAPALPPVPQPAGRDSPEHRFLHSARRKSFGRNKALPTPPAGTADDVPTPPLSPRYSIGGSQSIDENTAPAGSRTSRFFKRMSNIGNPSKRRSAAAQSVNSGVGATNDSVASRSGSMAVEKDRSDMPPAVNVGELNVQFPDTLLWKRRALSLSETGHLFLSVPSSDHSRASLPPKRYHLSDFKAPYTPDLDRQELPWSIWLEFLAGDGGVLQVACDDQMGRGQVLMLLKGYWKAWGA